MAQKRPPREDGYTDRDAALGKFAGPHREDLIRVRTSHMGKSARADEDRRSHRRARNSQRNPRAGDLAYTNESAFQTFGCKDWCNVSLFFLPSSRGERSGHRRGGKAFWCSSLDATV